MQLDIKKIGTTLMGSVLTGATLLGGALAADISAFANMGPSDTVVVVGASAATSDVVGAINIGAALAQHGVSATGSGAVTTTVDNGVALFDTNNPLYLGKKLNAARDTVTATEFPNLLAKGTFEDDDGTSYDYTQSITIGSTASLPDIEFGQTTSGTDPVMMAKLGTTASSQPLYTLKISFSKSVALNTTASKGNTLKLFGADFTVGAETTADKLVLYKSATDLTVNKDEEVKVTVGGTEYSVFVKGFTTAGTGVILTVGSETKTVTEGTSKKVGGLAVYAKTVSSWDNGNKGLATLQVGSEKITLQAGDSIRTGDSDVSVDGTYIKFNGGITSGKVGSISSIDILVTAKDSDHDEIAKGTEFTDPFVGTIKVSYGSVSSEPKGSDRDQIKLRSSGDFKGYVAFKDANGRDGTIYFVRGSESASDTYKVEDDTGDYDSSAIRLYEGASATKSDTQKDSLYLAPGDTRYTHLVKMKSIKNATTDGYVEFTDVVSGDTYTTDKGDTSAPAKTLTLSVDGKAYTATIVSPTAVNVTYDADSKRVIYPAIKLSNGEDMAITAPITGMGIINNTVLTFPTGDFTFNNDTFSSGVATYNATVGKVKYMLTRTPATAILTGVNVLDPSASDALVTVPAILVVEEADKDTNKNVVLIKVTDGSSGDTKTYISYDTPGMSATTKSSASTSNDKLMAYLDYYGTYAEKDTSTDKHAYVTLYYPDVQMQSYVYLLASTAAAPTGGVVGGVRLPSLGSGVSKLDTEIGADKTAKNLILVGGPAINTLVAELGTAGKTPTLTEWRTKLQGKGIVQAVGDAFTAGKTAIVVAGYEKGETLAASLKLAQDYSGGATPALKGTAQQYIGGVWSTFTYPLGNTTA